MRTNYATTTLPMHTTIVSYNWKIQAIQFNCLTFMCFRIANTRLKKTPDFCQRNCYMKIYNYFFFKLQSALLKALKQHNRRMFHHLNSKYCKNISKYLTLQKSYWQKNMPKIYCYRCKALTFLSWASPVMRQKGRKREFLEEHKNIKNALQGYLSGPAAPVCCL